MVRRNFSIKGLKPEEYKGFRLYFKKDSQGRYGVKIQDKKSKQVVATIIHSYDGDYFDRSAATKAGAMAKAKERIDEDLSEMDIELIRKGDLFYNSWGYDQTNIDFIIITEVSDTGKTVKARRTRAKTVDSTGFYDSLKPVIEPYGDEFRLSVRYWNGEPTLKGKYPYSDGDMSRGSMSGSFSPVDEDRSYAQTDSRYGH